jgi:hypothetical protein
MKKKLLKSLVLSGLLLAASLSFGQTLLTMTTLSSAVNGGASSANSTTNLTTSNISVGSATGISAPSPNTGPIAVQATSEAQTYLYVDRELMQVKAVSGTTIQVIRGVESTQSSSHASGALVFVIPALYMGGSNARFLSVPQGSCTRSNELYLPIIQFVSGTVADCLGGQWVVGDSTETTRPLVTGSTTAANGFRYPDPGGTALTALQTSGTAPAAATQIECSELDLPFSMYLSGLAPLNGTTVGTDKHWVLLYDLGGAVLANSAAAGATTSTASIYQKYSFVTPYYAVGPARYFACYGSNGTTDTIRHAVTGTNDNILGGAVTGQVFGTAAAITVPSTFTTAKVPYFMTF